VALDVVFSVAWIADPALCNIGRGFLSAEIIDPGDIAATRKIFTDR
jgi:hypothetical protein